MAADNPNQDDWLADLLVEALDSTDAARIRYLVALIALGAEQDKQQEAPVQENG